MRPRAPSSKKTPPARRWSSSRRPSADVKEDSASEEVEQQEEAESADGKEDSTSERAEHEKAEVGGTRPGGATERNERLDAPSDYEQLDATSGDQGAATKSAP